MSKATDYLVEQIRERDKRIQEMTEQRAQDWNTGFSAAVYQHMTQEKDPNHALRRDNPFGFVP